MSSETLSELPPLRILIVEDDPLIQLGLEQYLKKYTQFEIVGQEADGYSGIEAALKLKPDLVIMEICLPQLDGIEATHQIKATLYLSPSTVKTIIRGTMNKLAVDDTVQAAVVALRSGLV